MSVSYSPTIVALYDTLLSAYHVIMGSLWRMLGWRVCCEVGQYGAPVVSEEYV